MIRQQERFDNGYFSRADLQMNLAKFSILLLKFHFFEQVHHLISHLSANIDLVKAGRIF